MTYQSVDELILKLLCQAKLLAHRYCILTKKPLSITGEVPEYEASRLLGTRLTPARQAGYHAIELVGQPAAQMFGESPIDSLAIQRTTPLFLLSPALQGES